MIKWTKESENRILVKQSSTIFGYIFGLPFLAIGFYFFFNYFIMGIYSYIAADDWGGLFSNILGWLVIILITSAFLVPGWLIVFLRQSTIIDTSLNEVVRTQDFLVFKKINRYTTDQFKSVHVNQTRRRSTASKTRTLYAVELKLHDDKTVVLGVDEMEPARKLREHVAKMLDLKKTVHGSSQSK